VTITTIIFFFWTTTSYCAHVVVDVDSRSANKDSSPNDVQKYWIPAAIAVGAATVLLVVAAVLYKSWVAPDGASSSSGDAQSKVAVPYKEVSNETGDQL
jgi:protein-S-isoprenylcysteine O-methyltransferase Ste14